MFLLRAYPVAPMMVSFIEAIPILIFVGLPITFITTYIWSVCQEHVYPFLPGISDTGTIPPESCLFSMMLNLTAAALVFAVYLRHKQIVEIFRSKNPSENAKMVNRVATITGLVACIGLDLVANFQETNVLIVHGIGGVMSIWSASIYILLQVVLSFWIVPEMHGLSMVVIRAIQGISAVAFLSIGIYTEAMAVAEFGPRHFNESEVLQWTPDKPGYAYHVAGSICEWSIVLIFGSFILTYHWDFKKITLYAPELELVEDEKDERDVQPTTFRIIGY